MTLTANLSRNSSAAHRPLAGLLTARLSKPLPVQSAVEVVEVDVDVTVAADDIITVSDGETGKAINLFFLADIMPWGSTDPDVVMETIAEHRPEQINLYIGSYGGDVATALRLYDILRASSAEVTVYLTGICASAATLIACAADRVIMSRQCLYMTHSAGTWPGFIDGDSIANLSNQISAFNSTMTDIYARKTGRDKAEMQQYVTGETWLDADGALAAGFVDEVVDGITLDLDLPSDVTQCYDAYYCDDYWYAFYDRAIQKMKDEATVFTACLAQRNGQPAGAAATTATVTPNSEPEMKEFINGLITALATAGYIKKDQVDAAKNDVAEQSAPLLTALVAEVKAELATTETDAAAPAETTPTLIEQIGELTDEEAAALAERLAPITDESTVVEPDPQVAELTAQVAKLTADNEAVNARLKEVTNAVSASRAGRATTTANAPATNGGSDMTDPPAPEKIATDHARYDFALKAYRSGAITAAQFAAETGHAAPAK